MNYSFVGIIEIAHSEKIIRKSRRAEGKNLRVVVGLQASVWGVGHSKFFRAASQIFFIFYARAAVFMPLFAAKKWQINLFLFFNFF
jgi:hypothetical protein